MKDSPIALGCMLCDLFPASASAGPPIPGSHDTMAATPVRGKLPAADARFPGYSCGELARASSAEQGSLLPHYSDGTVVTVCKAPSGRLWFPHPEVSEVYDHA